MSRQFDTAAGADSITFSVGAAPPDQGPITVAILAKSASVVGYTGWLISGRKSGAGIWGLLTSNSAGPKLFAENDFGNGVSGLSTSWRWYVMTKASGSVAPRIHVWDLSGAWSHTDNSAAVADGTGPIDALILGSNGTNGFRGSIAVAAAWSSQLNDAAVEAAMTLAATDTLAAAPDWMVRLNQASTATAVTDDTAGGGDQTAISGTSVDADDPPGYDYALSGGTQTVAPDGIAAPVALGAPVVSQSLAAAPNGMAASVALGAPAVVMAVNLPGIVVSAGVGAPAVDGPRTVVTQGSWDSLLGILASARADAAQQRERDAHPIDCPEHQWPLQRVSDGVYHCIFGGHTVHGM